MARRPVVAVFLKAPRLGAVKTRLAAGIGDAAALRFHRTQADRLIRSLARDRRWNVTLWLTPHGARRARDVPRLDLCRFDQGMGDLGRRMARPFRLLNGPAIVIGTDIPDLTPVIVARAFRLLRNHDAVFGPATDGGFWLVGLNGRFRRRAPFKNIRWSTAHAMADTLAQMRGARIALLPPLDDIDTPSDYARWRSQSERSKSR